MWPRPALFPACQLLIVTLVANPARGLNEDLLEGSSGEGPQGVIKAHITICLIMSERKK